MTKYLIGLCVSMLCFSVNAYANDVVNDNADGVSIELDRLIESAEKVIAQRTYRGRAKSVKRFAQDIKWKGISDERVYTLFHNELLHAKEVAFKKPWNEYYAWVVQIVAFSGLEKYRAAIESKVRNSNNKLSRHASSALKVMDEFHVWNPIISKNIAGLSIDNIDKARIENMLMSEIPELNRAASSLIIDSHIDDVELTDKVEARLKIAHPNVGVDPERAEAAAWMCKLLGKTGKGKYVATLNFVSDETRSGAVKRWAYKAMEEIGVGPMSVDE